MNHRDHNLFKSRASADHGVTVPETVTMQDQVAEVIEEIRPYINMDGGDIELLGVDTDTGIVTVRLMGACDSCSMTMITLKAGLETRLKQVVPGVTEVVQV